MQVEVTGDSARTISHFLFLAGTAIAIAGTYRDERIRTSRGWRIGTRDVTSG